MLVTAQAYDLQISTQAGCLHHTSLGPKKFTRSQLPLSGSHAQILGLLNGFFQYVNLGKKAKSKLCVSVFQLSEEEKQRKSL